MRYVAYIRNYTFVNFIVTLFKPIIAELIGHSAGATLHIIAAVLNLSRLKDPLQILSLGCGPPPKIVSWKIVKNASACVYLIKK